MHPYLYHDYLILYNCTTTKYLEAFLMILWVVKNELIYINKSDLNQNIKKNQTNIFKIFTIHTYNKAVDFLLKKKRISSKETWNKGVLHQFTVVWHNIRILSICWLIFCQLVRQDLDYIWSQCYISYLSSLHYIWRSLGPFILPCAQNWP